jgi:hypothetical protein
MGVDAIDQTICPEVQGMTKCSIAWGQRPNAIEHLVIPSTEGQIVWSIVSLYIIISIIIIIVIHSDVSPRV